ncbi:hypothetical protein [Paenibacillus sp. L3-i20]|uniref:hypothetical protein n=1 Tax=Paenibacillus sp. L3-i20 TaxID=2905833 RepID=UPI001EE0B17B|nr:hypothetical protein [Paenibacillus sp. L3-i20]GKU77006.1 hypothetical protein L3i20_v214030 [Paenibacillus sp. L3-i20]
MKRISRYVLIVTMIMVVVISGCSSKTPPKAALQAAILKTTGAESYKLSMTVQIDELDIPVATSVNNFPIGSFAGVLKDATIKIDAIYSKKSVRTDMNVEVVLPGMMDMKIAFPMIMKDKLLYIKLPEIPLIQLPESVVGKYIVIDADKLAAKQGTKTGISVAEQQKLIQELSEASLKHFDEEKYFNNVKVADAGLPEGVKVDQVVKFVIDEGNYAGTAELLANKVLPELLDVVLSNETAQRALQVDKAKLEKLRADWDTNKTELLNVLQNDFKIHVLELMGAIKDKYLVHQNGKINVEATNKESGLTKKIGFTFAGQYSEIDKDLTFNQEIPTDALPWDQVKQLLAAPSAL